MRSRAVATSLALDALLADDVVFLSPVVRTPQLGRALAKAYLERRAGRRCCNETFRYVGEWIRARISAVLEFVATIDGVEVNGADLHRLERRRSDRQLQGDDPAVEGDRAGAAAHGGATRARLSDAAVRARGRGSLFAPRPAPDALLDAAECRRRGARDRATGAASARPRRRKRL